jgi:hypothetical protein
MTEKKKTQKEILLENADKVIEMIEDACSYDDICKEFSVNRKYVYEFIAQSIYSARIKEAQKNAADKISEKAEQVLLKLEKGCDNAEIARARELAHHYRWLAAKKNPQAYSEKVQTDNKHSINLQDSFVLKRNTKQHEIVKDD